MDSNKDTVKRNGKWITVGERIGSSNMVCSLGFNVVLGDDGWGSPMKTYQFLYDKDSANCVVVRKWE